MAKGTLQIDFLGASFSISADKSSEYLQTLLMHYKRVASQIAMTTTTKDNLQIAILTGIMLCDELHQIAPKKEEQSDIELPEPIELAEAEKLTLNLIQKIDSVL